VSGTRCTIVSVCFLLFLFELTDLTGQTLFSCCAIRPPALRGLYYSVVSGSPRQGVDNSSCWANLFLGKVRTTRLIVLKTHPTAIAFRS
jgi:hypothetical protein